MSIWNADSSTTTIAPAEAITYYNCKQQHWQDNKRGQLQKSKKWRKMNILPKSPRSPCICMSSWNAGSSNNTIAQAEDITYYNSKQQHCQDSKGSQLQKSKKWKFEKKYKLPSRNYGQLQCWDFYPRIFMCVAINTKQYHWLDAYRGSLPV